MKTDRYSGTFYISKVYDCNNKPVISVKVENLTAPTTISFQHYRLVIGEIEGMELEPSKVKGINIDALYDEANYYAEGCVDILYATNYDYWSGARETDIEVFLDVFDYEKRRSVGDACYNDSFYPKDSSFCLTYNNDGNHIIIRRVNDGKLSVNVAESCVSRKFTLSSDKLCNMLMNLSFER